MTEFGDESVLKVVDNASKPTEPKGDEVRNVNTLDEKTKKTEQILIKVHCAGVNPVDTYIRAGTYVRRPQLPYVPGMDAAGVVEAIGTDVKHFKVVKCVLRRDQKEPFCRQAIVSSARRL